MKVSNKELLGVLSGATADHPHAILPSTMPTNISREPRSKKYKLEYENGDNIVIDRQYNTLSHTTSNGYRIYHTKSAVHMANSTRASGDTSSFTNEHGLIENHNKNSMYHTPAIHEDDHPEFVKHILNNYIKGRKTPQLVDTSHPLVQKIISHGLPIKQSDTLHLHGDDMVTVSEKNKPIFTYWGAVGVTDHRPASNDTIRRVWFPDYAEHEPHTYHNGYGGFARTEVYDKDSMSNHTGEKPFSFKRD